MLRFAALVALVAVTGCCSAFNLEVSDSLQTYVASQGEDAVGRQFFFPCDGVSAKELESLDLSRYQGHWFSTNIAFSSSHKIDSDIIQNQISTTVNCHVSAFNNMSCFVTDVSNKTWQQLVGLRSPLNESTVVPGWQVVDNGTALYRSSNVSLPRSGNNGKWLLSVDIGNSSSVLLEVRIVATDYTKTALWYSCQDVPVPFTADTVREQTWGILRRRPRNFSSIELAVLKLAALGRGIVDADRLYTLPTDGC